MNHDEQVALMRQAFAHIDAGTTDLADAVSFNPVTAYTCPKRLARESALLFRKYPLLMGLSNQIPQPGDHFTDDLSGIPILVVRGWLTARKSPDSIRWPRIRSGETCTRLPSCARKPDAAGLLPSTPHGRSGPGSHWSLRSINSRSMMMIVTPCWSPAA
jgi:hypothetical protein